MNNEYTSSVMSALEIALTNHRLHEVWQTIQTKQLVTRSWTQLLYDAQAPRLHQIRTYKDIVERLKAFILGEDDDKELYFDTLEVFGITNATLIPLKKLMLVAIEQMQSKSIHVQTFLNCSDMDNVALLVDEFLQWQLRFHCDLLENVQ